MNTGATYGKNDRKLSRSFPETVAAIALPMAFYTLARIKIDKEENRSDSWRKFDPSSSLVDVGQPNLHPLLMRLQREGTISPVETRTAIFCDRKSL